MKLHCLLGFHRWTWPEPSHIIGRLYEQSPYCQDCPKKIYATRKIGPPRYAIEITPEQFDALAGSGDGQA